MFTLKMTSWSFLRGFVVYLHNSSVLISSNKILEVKSLMEEFNFIHCDLYNPNNWGVYNNKVVLLDYGITESISKLYKLKKWDTLYLI